MKGVIGDDLTIRCPTFVSTQKVRDLEACADVSVTCGDTDSGRPGTYFQITAQARISQESTDRRRAWTPRLEKWFGSADDPNYAVVIIDPIRIVALPIGGGPAAEVWAADS
jgi:general stress protein 26